MQEGNLPTAGAPRLVLSGERASLPEDPNKHIAHVDGLRALAVLSVMLYHLRPQWLPGGLTGVDVFFAISGFVVTASLAQHGREGVFAFVAAFYHRRLTRILPALLVVLMVTALLYAVLIPRSWLSGMTENVAFWAFFGLSNLVLENQSDAYFAPRAEFNPFTHTWSLGVEEQFYLIAPCLIYLHVRALRGDSRFHRHPWGVGLLGLLSIGAMAYWTRSAPLSAFYGVAGRFCELAAGCLWYLYIWRGRAHVAGVRLAWALDALGVSVIVAVLAFTRTDRFPFPWALLAAGGAVLLIGFPGYATPIRRVFESGAAQFVGLRSYSLYLWHWPIYVLLRWTIGLDSLWIGMAAVVFTFLCAEASYRWVEMPLRRSVPWRSLRPAFAISISLAVATVSAFAAREMLTSLNSLGASTVTRNRTDWYADHDDPTLGSLNLPCVSQLRYREAGGILVIEYDRVSCNNGTPARPEEVSNIFVLGDSHATMYLPLLHRLSVMTGSSIHVYQVPGCPFVDFRGPVGKGRPSECTSLPPKELADVLTLAKPGDIVFLPSLRLPRFVDQWGRLDEAEALRVLLGPGSDGERAEGVADAYKWLRPMSDHGLKVVFEAPTPVFRSPAFRCADVWTRTNDICSRGLSESREWEEHLRRPIIGSMQTLAQSLPGISIYDPLPQLCDARTCSAKSVSGRPLFFDADHLSRYGNEVLFPSFLHHLESIGARGISGPLVR